MIVLDIECYFDLFCVCTKDTETNQKEEFIKWRDQIDSTHNLFDYLEGKEVVTFNGVNYDMVVLDIIRSYYSKNESLSPTEIYKISQSTINSNKIAEVSWCRHIDLFKIKHFDNAAKRTSLKQLEIAMRMQKVQDLPYDFTEPLQENEMREVVEYCHYDVEATATFLNYIKPEIEVRDILSSELGFDTTNMNDAQIGSEVTLREVAKQKNMSEYDVRKMRTHRPYIKLSDCINHERLTFSKNHPILNIYGKKKIKNTKGELKIKHIHKGVKYIFGTGGLHGAKTGRYYSDNNYVIMSSDVSSYYPNLSIVNNYYPKHIGSIWIEIEKKWYCIKNDTKKKAKSLDKDTKEYKVTKAYNALSKLLLNAGYGKSKDKYSFMFDPKYTMLICVNGQIQLFNLVEILSNIGKVIMANTDGIETIIPRSKQQEYYDICNVWMELTGLVLEHDHYDQLYVSDVNNYIGIKDNAIVKRKGAAYETRDDKIAAGNWHKDMSANIVRIAMSEYVLNNIAVEQTIRSHKDVWDFVISSKASFTPENGQAYHITMQIKKDEYGSHKIEKFHQKNIRFIVTNTGSTLFKYYPDIKSYSAVCKGHYVNLCLNIESNYDINYNYYIQRAKDIINKVEGEPLSLFNQDGYDIEEEEEYIDPYEETTLL